MEKNSKFIIHLVSDSSGETVQSITKACIAQFPETAFDLHNYALINRNFKIEEVIELIKKQPGIIFYSLVNNKIKNRFVNFIEKNRIKSIDILEKSVDILSKELNSKPTEKIGSQHAIDNAYFKRMDAMEYAQRNDDGQNLENIYSADIIILGVSRSSKTPTCMYLANKGFFVVNIPIIYGLPIDTKIKEINEKKSVFMIGLYMDEKHLVSIRKNRELGLLRNLKNYSDYETIAKELAFARNLYNQLGIPSINVSSRSIEETAAMIINRMEILCAKNKTLF